MYLIPRRTRGLVHCCPLCQALERLAVVIDILLNMIMILRNIMTRIYSHGCIIGCDDGDAFHNDDDD
jgi:hypothetical protein